MKEEDILKRLISETYNKKVEIIDNETNLKTTHYIIEKREGEGKAEIVYRNQNLVNGQTIDTFELNYMNGYDDPNGNSASSSFTSDKQNTKEFTFINLHNELIDELCDSYGVEDIAELKDNYGDDVNETLKFFRNFTKKFNSFKLASELNDSLEQKASKSRSTPKKI